jgi:hypothetical protein
LRVTLGGQLRARDLTRLERACGTALEQKFLPLELDTDRLSSIDEVARAYLEKLRTRGARLLGVLGVSLVSEPRAITDKSDR